MKSVAAILGSAFSADALTGLSPERLSVDTPWGATDVFRLPVAERPAYVVLRHGQPHRLPHQINYRAQAWALKQLGCGALLVTSSVGVLDPRLPLDRLLLVADLMTLDNRLPDGTACTIFDKPMAGQGHLLLSEGLFSGALTAQAERILQRALGLSNAALPRVVFAYSGGPRTKTAAENRMWARLGAQVNSMSLAPEVVLANELEIPCCAVVVGHKYSLAEKATSPNGAGISGSLERSREALFGGVLAFLREAEGVPFGNQLYRFEPER
jgi:purine nucleoside phosphorylase